MASRKRRRRDPNAGIAPPPGSKGETAGGGGGATGGGTSGGGGGTSPASTGGGTTGGTPKPGLTAAEKRAKEKEERLKRKQKRIEKLERKGDIKTYLAAAKEEGYDLNKRIRKLARKAEKGGWNISAFLFELEKTEQGKALEAEEQAADEASYLSILADLDIGLTPGLQSLVDAAVTNEYDQSAFMYLVSQTPEYQSRFGGSLPPGMTEGEFLALESDYYAIAREYGIQLTQAQVQHAIRTGLTPETLSIRFAALERVRENADVFAQFNEVRASQGKSTLDLQGMVDYVLGTAPQEFYDDWEQATLEYTAQQVGLSNNLLTSDDIRGIMSRYADRFDEAGALEFFTNLANEVRSKVPLSRLANLGVTERDVVEMELDPFNPKSAETASRIQQAIANIEAQSRQDLAGVPLTQGTEAQRRRPRQATL